MAHQHIRMIKKEVVDPKVLAAMQARRDAVIVVLGGYKAHAAEIYTRYRGKCICVAGEELFIAETPEEVLAIARAAHHRKPLT